ncbi:MAG: glycosyltransferase family 4 protein [Verrucomicrobia bacterium]|nr:glycosyltransferase family 4 protein [Verrucomicrobiota bacterium]
MNIAFVAPFYGNRAAGGAESECRNTAIHLAATGINVEILTTCALDLQHDWNVNYYKQGESSENGLVIRRFRTEPVDLTPFAQLNQRMLTGGQRLSLDEEKQFIAMHINSFGLYRYLAEHHARYDWICFIPYLFGTTYYGSMLCGDRSVLIPCLHDEAYARMGLFREMFSRVGKVVFHAGSEQRLAQDLYGDLNGRGILLGEGIDTEFESDGGRFRSKYGIEGRFILYAGRKHETKNVHTLVRHFSAYRKERGDDVRLVLMGPGSLSIPEDMEAGIVDLGYVPDQDKKDAYSAASVFCQPSLNESFSIVVMESWTCRTPCLVHGDCAVTREHVVESGGGLYFTSYGEFRGCLDYLLANGDAAGRMGEAGRRYVLSNYSWDVITRRYREMVFGD